MTRTKTAAQTVAGVMSGPVATCRPDTDLAAVAKLMWDHDCGVVPVVDASRRVMGVITDRDICIAATTRRLLPEQIHAEEAMTRPVHTCRPGDPVNAVLDMMKQFQVRRLPVTDDDGALQGIMSMNDIVLAAAQQHTPAATDVLATMAAICEHRAVAAPAV